MYIIVNLLRLTAGRVLSDNARSALWGRIIPLDKDKNINIPQKNTIPWN